MALCRRCVARVRRDRHGQRKRDRGLRKCSSLPSLPTGSPEEAFAQGDDIVDVAAISKEGAESQPIRAGQMLSITKLQAAGFCDVVDSEDMLVAMLSELQEQRVLPR